MAYLTVTHNSVNLSIVYSIHLYESGFSLRILVAGERCNVTEEYFESGSKSEYKIVIGYRTFARIMRNKRRILRSPMPNEPPVKSCLKF